MSPHTAMNLTGGRVCGEEVPHHLDLCQNRHGLLKRLHVHSMRMRRIGRCAQPAPYEGRLGAQKLLGRASRPLDTHATCRQHAQSICRQQRECQRIPWDASGTAITGLLTLLRTPSCRL